MAGVPELDIGSELFVWPWRIIERARRWGFNCGPAALCAVLDKNPDEIRPHLRDFEKRGYTNPSLMAAILRDLNVPFSRHYECLGANRPGEPRYFGLYPRFGLTRIQWAGPWTRQGVPIKARYRHTHWIAVRFDNPTVPSIFDVNAIFHGGWLPWDEWADSLVPWLLRETEPKASGDWWPTHSWEIKNGKETNRTPGDETTADEAGQSPEAGR